MLFYIFFIVISTWAINQIYVGQVIEYKQTTIKKVKLNMIHFYITSYIVGFKFIIFYCYIKVVNT